MFHVRPDAAEPIYSQLVRQIKHAVVTGVLAPGTQLPAIRQLASELVINPNTVARAYRELKHDGLLYGMHGRGSFVSYGQMRLGDSEHRRRLYGLIDQFWVEARVLGYSPEEVGDIVAEELRHRATAERKGNG
jgi:GntR family transcriptional regulator